MEKDLQKLMEMVEDNNRMLKQVRGVQRRSWWVTFFKWGMLIAISFGAYYVIQPFIENLNSAYSSVLDGVQSVQNTTSNIGGFLGKNN